MSGPQSPQAPGDTHPGPDGAHDGAQRPDGALLTPAGTAQLFHETYERLAPDFGYRTREASAKPWDDVPEQNRALMTATAGHVLAEVLRAAAEVLDPQVPIGGRPQAYGHRSAIKKLRALADEVAEGGGR